MIVSHSSEAVNHSLSGLEPNNIWITHNYHRSYKQMTGQKGNFIHFFCTNIPCAWFIGFFMNFSRFHQGRKTGCSNLVTDNKQDLTPCYPQKDGITVKNPHYCFNLQPWRATKIEFSDKLCLTYWHNLWIKPTLFDLSSAQRSLMWWSSRYPFWYR